MAEGGAWVSTALGQRVVSLPDGALVLEGRFPLRFEVESVRRDRAPCRTDRLTRTQQPRSVVTHRRCGLDETWTHLPEGLEHELTLQAPPAGAGPLRVRLAVQGPWHHQDEGGHVFAGPGGVDGLRYGNAFLVRGARRFPLEVARVEGALELIIPAAWVDAPGAFPLHIDPLLTLSAPASFPGPTGGLSLASEPALAFSPTVGLVVWVDDVWGGSDLYGALIDGQGNLLVSGLPLVLGPESHHKPAVVWNGASFTLAWEQPGSSGAPAVWHLNVSLDGRPFAAPREIPLAQAPSLAVLRDGGVLLAWGAHCTALVAPLATALTTSTSTGCEIARTALSTWDDAWFLAVEKSLSGGVSTVSGFLSLDGGMPSQPVVVLNTSQTSTDHPAVLMTSKNEALFFWRQGPDVLGAQCGTSGCIALATREDSTALALALTAGGGPVIGLMVDGGAVISAQRLAADAGPPAKLSEGGYSTQMALAPTPEADGGAVMVVWTDHHTSDHIHFSRFEFDPPLAPPEGTLTQLPLPQTQPQVALWGARGLAVWREGEDVLRGAEVEWSAGPLARLGPPFLLSKRARVERVDVASSPAGAMVAWVAPTVSGFTLNLQAVSGATPGSLVSYAAGPVVSAGPVVAFNGASFLTAFASGTTVEVVQLSPAPRLLFPGGGRVSQLDLACVAGVCAAAWATDLGIWVRRLDGATVDMGPGLHPALSHDGQRLHLAWAKGSAFGTATLELDGGTWTPGPDVVPDVPVSVRRLALAPGTPPVMAWSGLTAAGALRVWVRGGGQVVERSGAAPDLATTGLDEPNGVLVFERPLGGTYWDTRTAAAAFGLPPPDAGLPDAGTSRDAGPSTDAGASGADGGIPGGTDGGDSGPLLFHTTGCGCTSTPSLGWLGLLWLLLRLARRRPLHD